MGAAFSQREIPFGRIEARVRVEASDMDLGHAGEVVIARDAGPEILLVDPVNDAGDNVVRDLTGAISD